MTNTIIIVFSESREYTAYAQRSPKISREHSVCPRITAATTLCRDTLQGVVDRSCSQRRIKKSLREIGRHAITMLMVFLCTTDPAPFRISPLSQSLRSSSVVVSTMFFHITSQSPKTFHLHRHIGPFRASVRSVFLLLSMPWRSTCLLL